MKQLRLTHLERYEGGYVMRFAQTDRSPESQTSWNAMKDTLKQFGYRNTRWDPSYEFADDKAGGWWVTPSILGQIESVFYNMHEMLDWSDPIRDDDQPINEFVNFCHTAEDSNHAWQFQHTYQNAEAFQKKQQTDSPQPVIPPHVYRALIQLGFTSLPDTDSLKKRWRHLAKANHPDCGGNETVFKQLNDAHEIVKKHLEVRETVSAAWSWR